MPESDQVALYFLFGEARRRRRSEGVHRADGRSACPPRETQQGEGFLAACAGADLAHEQPDPDARAVLWSGTACRRRTKAGRYTDENGNSGSKPHTPAPLGSGLPGDLRDGAAPCWQRSDIRCSSTFAGPTTVAADAEMSSIALAGNGRSAAEYTPKGFVVLKRFHRTQGECATSNAARQPSDSGTSCWRSGVMRAEGETVVFEKDHYSDRRAWQRLPCMGRTCQRTGWNGKARTVRRSTP